MEMNETPEEIEARSIAVLNTRGENLAHKIIELLIASKIPGNYEDADVQAHALAELVALVISLGHNALEELIQFKKKLL